MPQQSSKFCRHCRRQVLAQRQGPSHVIHAILSLLTAGLWLVVWLLACVIQVGGWRCQVCGSKV